MIAANRQLLERAMAPEMRIGRGALQGVLAGATGSIALLTQPEPYAGLPGLLFLGGVVIWILTDWHEH